PPLCDPNGENIFNVSGKGSVTSPRFYFFGTCQYNSYGPNSIQEQLETYINNAMIKCVNFTIFEEAGYNTTAINEPVTTVTFSDKFFFVNITYPFKVRIGRNNVKSKASFEQKKDLRFKQFYEYIQGLLQKEYQNISFILEQDGNISGLGWDTKMSVLKIVDPCRYCAQNKHDDIYQIVDEGSFIRGNPLIFQIIVKNRAPVLDYIDFGQKYNIVAKEGDIIQINPFAMDPDENHLLYWYRGWMQDYYTTFDEVRCLSDIDDCRENIAEYMIKHDFAPGEGGNWTNSSIFQITHQNASYRTNRNDLGLHYVQVYVFDDEGLMDFQNISIFVGDVPVVIPDGENMFGDITNLNASVEDPYSLLANPKSLFTNVDMFRWKDVLEKFLIPTIQPEYIIPLGIHGPVSIENMTNVNFSIVGNHNITLAGRYDDNGEKWTLDSVFQIEVHECLPHQRNAAPYPYNNFQGDDDNSVVSYGNEPDPFLANHTCCNRTENADNKWGTITEGNPCYIYQDFGSVFSINLDLFNWDPYNPTNPINPEYETIQDNFDYYGINDQDPDFQNDIIERNFTRFCDGSRGNICNGTAIQAVAVKEDCPDWEDENSDPNIAYGPDERCQGPDPDFVTFGKVDGTNPGCYKYNYPLTFEKKYGLEPNGASSETEATGVCNYEEKCVSNPSNKRGYFNNYIDPSSTYYFCDATCYSGKCSRPNPNGCTDCRVLKDKPAVDTDENNPLCFGEADCPEVIGTCTEVGIGFCSDSNIGCEDISPGNDGDITNEDECVNNLIHGMQFREFFPENSNGDPSNIKEACVYRDYDTDDNEIACGNCNVLGVSSEIINDECCGDELHEYPKETACCNDLNDCVHEGVCYNSGYFYSSKGECVSGSWELEE
ncbi:hypothetical protein ACFLTH_12765, partial [Bacteroidota bacterium]